VHDDQKLEILGMPLYAILHSDIEGLHDHSCTVVTAASRIEIVQQMIADLNRWQPLLAQLYPDDDDPRSVWQRIQTDTLSPEIVLAWIDQSYCTDSAEMLRIQPVELQSLTHVRVATRWRNAHPSDRSFECRAESINSLPAHIPKAFAALLAADARAVLNTQPFAAFIEFLLESVASDRISSAPLLIAPSPTFWLLHSQPIALHLRNIECLQLDNRDGTDGDTVIRMQVAIQDWQQPVHVFSQELRQQCQVAKVFNQVQSQFPLTDPGGDEIPYLNQVVIQELACVVLYVARLFGLNQVTTIDRGFEL